MCVVMLVSIVVSCCGQPQADMHSQLALSVAIVAKDVWALHV